MVWPEIRLRAPGVDGPKKRRRSCRSRVMLRVVPYAGDGVAVVIAHHLALGAGYALAGAHFKSGRAFYGRNRSYRIIVARSVFSAV